MTNEERARKLMADIYECGEHEPNVTLILAYDDEIRRACSKKVIAEARRRDCYRLPPGSYDWIYAAIMTTKGADDGR